MALLLEELKNEVFRRRPVLGEITEKWGGLSLMEYAKKYWEIPARLPDEVFLMAIKTELEVIYGQQLAQNSINQLVNNPVVSTIDHLGIWNHPIFVNADLIYSLHFGQIDLPLILATESVSLNNTSSWSASLIWHNSEGNTERHSFLPDKVKTLPVFSAPAIQKGDISRFRTATKGKLDALLGVLDLETSSADSFSVQACRSSSKFWQALFPSAPKLVYLPLETIISKYLLEVFKDAHSILSRLIFTKAGRELWQKYFGDDHTFMFWELDEKGRRREMKSLPENISQLLVRRKIYPSSALCFIIFLKAGIACVGGFTQTTWLTEVKEKFARLLLEMGPHENWAADISRVPTKNFAESSLARLSHYGRLVTPTAVDLFLTGKDYYSQYCKLAERLPLSESIEAVLAEIYRIVTPTKEQDPKLAALKNI